MGKNHKFTETPRRCPRCLSGSCGRDKNGKKFCPSCGWTAAGHKRDRLAKKVQTQPKKSKLVGYLKSGAAIFK